MLSCHCSFYPNSITLILVCTSSPCHRCLPLSFNMGLVIFSWCMWVDVHPTNKPIEAVLKAKNSIIFEQNTFGLIEKMFSVCHTSIWWFVVATWWVGREKKEEIIWKSCNWIMNAYLSSYEFRKISVICGAYMQSARTDVWCVLYGIVSPLFRIFDA